MCDYSLQEAHNLLGEEVGSDHFCLTLAMPSELTRPELLLGSTCSVNGCEAFIIMLFWVCHRGHPMWPSCGGLVPQLHANHIVYSQHPACTSRQNQSHRMGCSVQGMATSIQTSPPSDIQPLGTGVEKETDDGQHAT